MRWDWGFLIDWRSPFNHLTSWEKAQNSNSQKPPFDSFRIFSSDTTFHRAKLLRSTRVISLFPISMNFTIIHLGIIRFRKPKGFLKTHHRSNQPTTYYLFMISPAILRSFAPRKSLHNKHSSNFRKSIKLWNQKILLLRRKCRCLCWDRKLAVIDRAKRQKSILRTATCLNFYST